MIRSSGLSQHGTNFRSSIDFPLKNSRVNFSANQSDVQDPPSTLFNEKSFSHISGSEIKEDYWNFACKSSTKDFDLQFLDEISKMYAPQKPKPQLSLLDESFIASELDSNFNPRATQTQNLADPNIENYNYKDLRILTHELPSSKMVC